MVSIKSRTWPLNSLLKPLNGLWKHRKKVLSISQSLSRKIIKGLVKWKSFSHVRLFVIPRNSQARILERVAIPFSRGSSQPRDLTPVSHIVSGFFTSWATREARLDFLPKPDRLMVPAVKSRRIHGGLVNNMWAMRHVHFWQTF